MVDKFGIEVFSAGGEGTAWYQLTEWCDEVAAVDAAFNLANAGRPWEVRRRTGKHVREDKRFAVFTNLPDGCQWMRAEEQRVAVGRDAVKKLPQESRTRFVYDVGEGA